MDAIVSSSGDQVSLASLSLVSNRLHKSRAGYAHGFENEVSRTVAESRIDLVALLHSIARERSRDAFSVLFRHFAPRVKSYLMRNGTAGDMAEELAQETLLRVWRKAHQFNPSKASPSTWIFRIARNLRIDTIRREHRPEFDPHDPALVPDPDIPADQHVDKSQQLNRLRLVLHTLPEDQKQAIVLSFFEDKSHSAIADELGLPLGTVKSRIRLAFARVRTALGDME